MNTRSPGASASTSVSGWSYPASAISAPPRSGAWPIVRVTARTWTFLRVSSATISPPTRPLAPVTTIIPFEGTPVSEALEDLGAPRGTLDPKQRVRASEPSPRPLLRATGSCELREREATEERRPESLDVGADVRSPRRPLHPPAGLERPRSHVVGELRIGGHVDRHATVRC